MWGIIAKIVIAVISAVLSYSSAKGSSRQAPASFEDFDFPQFDEGTPIAHVFGDVWTDDWMVLAVGNFNPVQMKVKV